METKNDNATMEETAIRGNKYELSTFFTLYD